MPKLIGFPPTTIPLKEVLERLGVAENSFYKSGLAGLLSYYQVGRTKLYLTGQVSQVEYWLFVRRGLVALGQIPRNSPLLPPGGGGDSDEQWDYLDAWFEEDPNGAECPQCGWPAVEADGVFWCPKCGIYEERGLTINE